MRSGSEFSSPKAATASTPTTSSSASPTNRLTATRRPTSSTSTTTTARALLHGYTSLSRYANAVQSSPAQLAKVAIGVSLSNAKHIAAFVSNLSHHADYSSDHRAAAALHDCFSNFDDAVDQIRDSLSQMKALGSGPGSVRFQMSNVQTWMSAALTDQETCTDGFQDVPDGSVKSNLVKRAEKVKKVTSNALALVNSVAEKSG